MTGRGKVATTVEETAYIQRERRRAASDIAKRLYPGRREPYLPGGYTLQLERLRRNRDGSLSGSLRVTGEWLLRAYVRNFRTPPVLNKGRRISGYNRSLTR